MRRWLMAMVLLAGIVNLSWADYAVIRIILPSKGEDAKDPNVPPKDPAPKDPAHMKATDYVQAVVEVKKGEFTVPEFNNIKVPSYEHHKADRFIDPHWREIPELYDPTEIRWQFIRPRSVKKASEKGDSEIVLKSPLLQFTDRLTSLGKGKDVASLVKAKEVDADGLLKLASWCLEVGLPDKCQEALNELDKLAAVKDANLSPATAKAAEAYKKIKSILTDPLTKTETAASWKTKLNYSNIESRAHYALIHNSEDPARDGVERRLAALENNFKTFYLFFAVRGKALPAPREKLTAVLVADSGVFQKLRKAFDATERITDGSHLRPVNLVVFALDRLDKASQRFDQQMKSINQSHTGIDLLKAQFRPLSAAKDQAELEANNKKIKNDARAHIFALMDNALREEADIATATHEGTGQLLVETGLLPRNALVPEWLRYGMASLFEMPKGPFPGHPDTVRNAFWTGAGGPHWAWRGHFDEMVRVKLIEDPPTEPLVLTLLGRWADHARNLRLNNLPKDEAVLDPEEEAEAVENDVAGARCLAWALCFYLVNERFDEFMKFLTELSDLPRDVEFDEYTFLTVFDRAFGIDTAGMTPAQPVGNMEAYAKFAKAWIDKMRLYTALKVPLKFEEPRKDLKDPRANPNMN